MQELFHIETSTQSQGFDRAIYDRVLTESGAFTRYSVTVSNPSGVAEFDEIDQQNAAFDLAFAIFAAADAAAAPDSPFLIFYSGGKDSTLTLALWVQYLLSRRAQGLPLRRTVVSTSDTGAEFPEMTSRMYQEAAAIENYGKSQGLPIESIIAKPGVKDRLNVQIIGKGRSLPSLAKKVSSGSGASNWCVDYLKIKVGKDALKQVKNLAPSHVKVLGTRFDESSKRKQSMEQYNAGMSLGTTETIDSRSGDMGLTPIAFVTDKMLRSWLYENMGAERTMEKGGVVPEGYQSVTPWRPGSLAELVRIYRKAGAGAEMAGECSLVAAKDGSVANVCGDLSGVRMGCATCLKTTKNKSLNNFALMDPRYKAIADWHQEVVAKRHESDNQRRAIRDSHGFSADTLFPKGLTFRERYRLLVLLFAAEIESHNYPEHGEGFKLVSEEELEMIEFMWNRSGVFNISPEQARVDARHYLETGELHFSWEEEEFSQAKFMKAFSDGMPAGAWFKQFANPLVADGRYRWNDLEWHNLLGFAASGIGTPPVPTLMAYLFQDVRDADRVMVYVTDTPTSLGHPTNTKLLNGYCGAAWKLCNCREVTDWERQMSHGRSFLYALNLRTQRIVRAGNDEEDFTPAQLQWADLVYSTEKALYTGCTFEDAFADNESSWLMLNELIGKIDQPTFDAAMKLTIEAVILSDSLEDEIGARAAQLQAEFSSPDYWDQLESIQFAFGVDDTAAKKLPESEQTARREAVEERKAMFRGFRQRVKDILQVDDFTEDMERYLGLIDAMSFLARSGKANYVLFEKLAYVVRNSIYDPAYAQEEADRLAQRFGLTAWTPVFTVAGVPESGEPLPVDSKQPEFALV